MCTNNFWLAAGLNLGQAKSTINHHLQLAYTVLILSILRTVHDLFLLSSLDQCRPKSDHLRTLFLQLRIRSKSVAVG